MNNTTAKYKVVAARVVGKLEEEINKLAGQGYIVDQFATAHFNEERVERSIHADSKHKVKEDFVCLFTVIMRHDPRD